MKEEDIALTEEHPELDLQHVVKVINSTLSDCPKILISGSLLA
jgi:hypothetical protein